MEEEQPKRGRGRPKGSLNKKTLEKQAALKEATTLDVSFEKEEEPEQVEEPEKAEEVEEVVVEEAQVGRATEEGIEDGTERIKTLEGANG